jgi:transposase
VGKRGRLYSPGFKEEAIWLVHSCEEKFPVAKTTRDLDVSTETLRKWVNQTQIGAGEHDGLTTEEKEELRRLRKEVKVLKEEREIVRCALDVCCVVCKVKRGPSEIFPSKGASDGPPRAYPTVSPPGRGYDRFVLPNR